MVRFRSFSLRGRQDSIAADLASCAAMCDKVRGCHGYVYVEDVSANDEASRGLCSLKYGDVFVSGEHSQPRTVAQLSRYKYSTSHRCLKLLSTLMAMSVRNSCSSHPY